MIFKNVLSKIFHWNKTKLAEKKLSENLQQDVMYIHILIPILLSIGILLYYSLPFEPSSVHFLIPAFIIFSLYKINKQICTSLALILAGAIAFKVRISNINYKPVQVTAKSIPITGAIDQITIRERDENESTESISDTNENESKKTYLKLTLKNIKYDTSKEYNSTIIDYTSLLPEKATLYIADNIPYNHIKVGQTISSIAKFRPITANALPNQQDPRFFAFFNNVGSTGQILSPIKILLESKHTFLQRATHRIESFFITHLGQNAGIGISLILGDKSHISNQQMKIFQNIGISHVLAISGMHLGILMMVCIWFGKLLGLSVMRIRIMKIRGNDIKIQKVTKNPIYNHSNTNHNLLLYGKIFGVVIVLLYTLLISGSLAGTSFSLLRSAIMLIIGVWLYYSDRNVSLISILSLAATIILLFMPESLFYASFQFSVLVILAFSVFRLRINPLDYNIFSRSIIQTASSTLLATAITFPLAIYHFGSTAIQPFLANIILLPLIGLVIMPLLFGATLEAILGFGNIFGNFFSFGVFNFGGPFTLAANLALKIFTLTSQYLSHFSSLIYFTSPYPVALIILCLSLPFLICKSYLKNIAYFGIGFYLLAWIYGVEKPLLIADQMGRIAFKQNAKPDIVYVSTSTDKTFAKRAFEYFSGKKYTKQRTRGISAPSIINFTSQESELPEQFQVVSRGRTKQSVIWNIEGMNILKTNMHKENTTDITAKIPYIGYIMHEPDIKIPSLYLLFTNAKINQAKTNKALYAIHTITPDELMFSGAIALYKDGTIKRYQNLSNQRPWLFNVAHIKV